MVGLSSRFYQSGRASLNKKRGPTSILQRLLTNADYKLIHLSINFVEDFLLLSKIEIMLGVADINDFDLGMYNYAT
jgi:hypothetical protein